jgi:Spy/CpxP family protein refolding chaperone
MTLILILSTASVWAQEPQPAPPDVSTQRLQELQKVYTNSHPAVIAQQAIVAQQKARSYNAYGTGPGFGTGVTVGTGRLYVNMSERWWRNQNTAQSLGLTPDQQKKMDDIFQQHRLRLIDLNAALEKEEVTLEPLVSDDTLDDAKITAQIDRVAQARAELEKANGRMLLGIRKVLTPEQWRKVNLTKSK